MNSMNLISSRESDAQPLHKIWKKKRGFFSEPPLFGVQIPSPDKMNNMRKIMKNTFTPKRLNMLTMSKHRIIP